MPVNFRVISSWWFFAEHFTVYRVAIEIPYYLIIGFLFCWVSHAKAQKKLYDVFFMGTRVGSMTIERRVEGNMEFYDLRSHSAANLLLTHRENEVEMRSIYKNGLLISSFSKVTNNGEVESYASATWDGLKYQVQTEKGKFTVDEPAEFSVVKFYFFEPHTDKIFTERIGRFVPLYSPSKGIYQYRLPTGDLNIYTYKNGVLTDVTVKRNIGSAQIKPAKS
jgi:hypothetical protein